MTTATRSRADRLPPRIVLIGRAPGNDLVLHDAGVSARHARVVVEPDGLWLEDLGSRNGTFVGTPPRRIERESITLEDQITVGSTPLPRSSLRDLLERTQPLPSAGDAIQLEPASMVTFGRRAGANVAIDHPAVSALHASVTHEQGRVIVRDLGSMAGTFVDGRRIERPMEISPGSIVQVGERRFQLSSDRLSLEPVHAPADVIEAADVSVEASGRRLLEDVSLVVQPGEMVAIMGPSGAGKSTLLSVLNGQVMPAAGRIVVGGLDLHDHFDLFRGRIGYVPQDDILHADLTVWQALWYAARLRLPPDTTDAEIESRIRAVITQLGLAGTEQTRVGDQRKRGVSGGQRKRVNLAMELLTDPPILVLDEPTSGLSSTDTLSVIELLRKLADTGKTILVTIHQPSLDTFQKFDAVAVIARDASTGQIGRLAWYGRAWPDAVAFFEPPVPGAAPATNVDGLLRGLATRPVNDWVRQWQQSVAKSIWVDRRSGRYAAAAAGRTPPLPRVTAPLTQWWTLVRRTLAVKAADRWNTAVLIAQAPIVGLLIAAVFSKAVRHAPTLEIWPKVGVNMATTMFVTALAAIWFGCSSTAREIVTEWPIYNRERMVGLSILSYVASKVTVLLGIAALQCGLLLGIVAWTCQLGSSWWHLYAVLYAAALAGGAIGLFLSATLRTAEAAAGVLPVLLLPMIVLGGILVPLTDLPRLTQPLAAAMPSRWAFEGMVVPEALERPRLRPHQAATASPPPAGPAAPLTLPQPADSTPPSAPASHDETLHQPRRTRAGFAVARPVATDGPITLVAGREGRRFLLPGRQRIADALEEAAGKAEAEMQRAKQDAERKAEAMKRQVERDVEARGEAIQGQMKAEVEERGAEMQRRMQGEMEKRMQAAQADFERRTADMNATVQKTVEARVQEATQSFEKRLREMQDGMEQERKRMTQQLDSLGAIAAQTRRDVVPAATPPAHDDIDMAERFFPRTGWRSPVGLPLAVLGGMCVAGVAATAVVLMRRDTAGR
jgi:ABC-type multidrug transport system ATPase subunit